MSRGEDGTRLLLVRHGQIDANAEGIWHGSTDSALNERGRRQAMRVAELLARRRPRVAAVYASPLARTRHTAECIASELRLEVRTDPDLVEFGIGALEGVSYQALMDDHGFFERMLRDGDWTPPGGESRAAVTGRVTRALRRIADRHAGQEVVAVGHGAALGLALAGLLGGGPMAWRRYQMSNGSVSELALAPEPRLLSFDETDHLGE